VAPHLTEGNLMHLPILFLAAATSLLPKAHASPDPAALCADLRSPDVTIRQAAREQAVALGAPMVAPLFGLLSAGDPALTAVAENTLFRLAGVATAPGAGRRREQVAAALQAELVDGPADARAYAARLLSLAADDRESVRELSLALAEPETREAARTALQQLPGDDASKALITALTTAAADQRPALIHALGARRAREATDPLIRWASEGDPLTRAAALDALWQIGGDRAVGALAETGHADTPPPTKRR